MIGAELDIGILIYKALGTSDIVGIKGNVGVRSY